MRNKWYENISYAQYQQYWSSSPMWSEEKIDLGDIDFFKMYELEWIDTLRRSERCQFEFTVTNFGHIDIGSGKLKRAEFVDVVRSDKESVQKSTIGIVDLSNFELRNLAEKKEELRSMKNKNTPLIPAAGCRWSLHREVDRRLIVCLKGVTIMKLNDDYFIADLCHDSWLTNKLFDTSLHYKCDGFGGLKKLLLDIINGNE